MDPRLHLAILVECIEEQFDLPVRIGESMITPAAALDPVRNQYNSNLILQKLIEAAPREALRVVGIIRHDLFSPIFSFVFGEAQFGGRCAVVSTYRLRERGDERRRGRHPALMERLEKEIVHELGHTFGLRHCRDPNCVMCFSPGVESADRKFPFYCGVCHELLQYCLERELGRQEETGGSGA